MKISQSIKILIGIATAWLLFYPVLFIGFMLLMPLGLMMGESSDFMPFTGFGIIFPLHCLTFIVQLGLMAFYLIHILKNKIASETVRIILGVGVFFMPYIVMPLYYYLYIWRDVPPDWATGKPTAPPADGMLTYIPTIDALKEEEHKEPKSKKNLWLILIIIAVILILCLASMGFASYQMVSLFESNMAGFEELYNFPPESVPARTIQTTENLSFLWTQIMDIEDPHKTWVEFFTSDEYSMVFWSPNSESLISLDMASGQTLWEASVPDHSEMRLYDDIFFVLANAWSDEVMDAPGSDNPQWPNCSFAGKATLVTYNPQTGEQLWSYVYPGVDSYDMNFSDQGVYLTGSGDHGSSLSIAQIDTNTGELLNLDCYKWPDKKDIPSPPSYDAYVPLSYTVVVDKEDLIYYGDYKLLFVAEGTRLDVLEGKTKDVIGSVYFEGANLNPWNMNVVVQDNVAVVYLGDSDQFYSFRLPALED